MVLKLINATAAKPGTVVLVEGVPCAVRSNDISKTGKHGASKCRIESVGVFDGKKRIFATPGDEKLEVPLVEKKKAQVLTVADATASIMDLETFETLDVPFSEEVKDTIAPEKQIEYWIIENYKYIMRVL